MLYSILIYGSADSIHAWSAQEEDEILGRHADLRQELSAKGHLGPVLRLMPDTATTVRHNASGEAIITEGPFAETKEQLMGIYIVDCESDEAVKLAATRLAFNSAVFEIRPITWFDPGMVRLRAPPREIK